MNVYAYDQGLHYFNSKQKLNSPHVSWYLYLSEFINHIHYRHGFKMGQPDGLSRCLGEEKSTMYTDFLYKGQLLDLENDDVGEEQDARDIDLDSIFVAI